MIGARRTGPIVRPGRRLALKPRRRCRTRGGTPDGALHAPAGVSPDIVTAWTDYFQAYAIGMRRNASDDAIDKSAKGMEAAACRLATTPHRSLQDIAAKAQLVLYAQNDDGSASFAENDIRTSVLAAVVALAVGENVPLRWRRSAA